MNPARYDANASNFNVEYDKEKMSTVLDCDIHGTFSGSWYDFHCLLNPLGLDLIDSSFMKSEETLCWEGYIEGVPTIIILRFPFTKERCHAHVWRR